MNPTFDYSPLVFGDQDLEMAGLQLSKTQIERIARKRRKAEVARAAEIFQANRERAHLERVKEILEGYYVISRRREPAESQPA
jgi:hypothetical protein